MIPYGLPQKTNADVQIFRTPATFNNEQWHTWTKPPWATMIHITCIGGGGPGGGGATDIAGNARGGGGGGGSSSISSLLIPAYFLPDTLYIEVGFGGVGGGAGAAGGSGRLSYVSTYPNTNGLNVVLRSGNNNARSGGGGGTTGGAAGTADTIVTIANTIYAGLGLYNFIAGQNGLVGGAATSAGTNSTFPTTGIMTMGGSGGAGCTSSNFAGGGITASADSLVSQNRPIAPASGSNNGSGGAFQMPLFFNYPGLGGSSNNTGAGGFGGIGGFGSGGGGGGGGTTGGTGGDGGNGYVQIISW